ncbi:hypothetical protein JL720_6823 [Aureococcus anophagefferens]|nr:hypothetical protein JL720_6823 [Aureococcus anophagefferens]
MLAALKGAGGGAGGGRRSSVKDRMSVLRGSVLGGGGGGGEKKSALWDGAFGGGGGKQNPAMQAVLFHDLEPAKEGEGGETAARLAKEKLAYERDVLLFRDPAGLEPIEDQEAWDALRDGWNRGVSARRTEKVRQLAATATDKCLGLSAAEAEAQGSDYRSAPPPAAGSPEELKVGRAKIKGFEQLYELFEQFQNLTGLETAGRRIAFAVADCLRPQAHQQEIANAAALRRKMGKLSGAIAASRGGGSEVVEGALFCARASLGGGFATIGLLDALAARDSPRPRLMALIKWCADEISGGGAPNTFEQSEPSSGARTKNLSHLREEASDESSHSSYQSDDSSIVRSAITGPRASLFSKSYGSGDGSGKAVDAAIYNLIGQACLAAWGCAASLLEKDPGELDRLYEPPIASWNQSPEPSPAPSPPKPNLRQRGRAPEPERDPDGSHDGDESDDELGGMSPSRLVKADMGDESWIELLVRVAGMDDVIDHASAEAAAGCLAVAASGPGGCAAISRASKVPGLLLDRFCDLLEKSGSLRVRVCAAHALVSGTLKPSRSVNAFYTGRDKGATFYTGCIARPNKRAGRRTRGTITGATKVGSVDAEVLDLADSVKDDHVLHTTILQNMETAKFKPRADARIVDVIDDEIGSRKLEAATAAVLLNLALHACPTAARTEAVLKQHVAMIDADCFGEKSAGMLRSVLRRGCLAVWALARTRTNRRRLNDVDCAGALAAALGGGASLATKEAALAALWLLACDEAGAVKVALAAPTNSSAEFRENEARLRRPRAAARPNASSKAASLEDKPELPELAVRPSHATLARTSTIPVTVGIASFDPNLPGYCTIRMLALGLLHKLCMSSLDILNIVAAYATDLAPIILNTAHDPVPHRRGVVCAIGADDVEGASHRIIHDDGSASSESTASLAPQAAKRLQILAVETCFRLAECEEGARAIARARGTKALEALCATLLVHPRHYALRTIGAFRAAKLAQSTACRRQLVQCNAIELLVSNFHDPDAPAALRIYALHSLLNLSGETRIQPRLCKSALTPLLRIARVADDLPVAPPVKRTVLDADGEVVSWHHDAPHAHDDAKSEATSYDRMTKLRIPDDDNETAKMDRDLDLEARYAQSILANLSKNVTCRARMYQRHLKHASQALKRTIRADDAISASESISTAKHIVDDRTLSDFFANAKDRDFVSEKMAKRYNQIVAIHAKGPTEAQLQRLRRNFHDPVSRLWEEPPSTSAPQRRRPAARRRRRRRRRRRLGPDRRERSRRPGSPGGDPSTPSTWGGRRRRAPGRRGGRPPAVAAPQFSQRLSLVDNSPLLPASRALCAMPTIPGPESTSRPRASERHRRTNALRGVAARSPCGRRTASAPRRRRLAVAPGARTAGSRACSTTRATATTEGDGEATAVRFSPRVLELEPNAPYHKITFHAPPRRKKGNAGRSVADAPPARLCKFKHTPGAKMYKGLFPCYTLSLDAGDRATQREDAADERPGASRKEAVEHCALLGASASRRPGPSRMPAPPGTVDLLMRPVPPPPAVDVPDLDTLPATYRSRSKPAPDMKRHAIVLCATTGTFGGIPAQALPLYTRMVEKPPEPEAEEASLESEMPPAWEPDKSVFQSRVFESDSRAFFETPKVFKRAVQCDFTRLLGEERFARFVGKMDEGVAKDGDNVDEELEEVKEAFLSRYGTVLRIFDYYCACSSATNKSAFSISENNFNRFVSDCAIADDSTACTASECSKIFIVCNFETDKTSAANEVNDDRALMRYEFMECLVRMAVARFRHEINDVSECLDRLFDEVILPNIDPSAVLDPDIFRRDKFYFQAVDDAFKPHAKYLKLVYMKYSLLNPVAGKAKFGLVEWDALIKDCKLISDDLTSREMRLAFWWSRMVVIDEVKQRAKFMTLTWVEFLEALGRMAEMMTLPDDDDLRKDEINHKHEAEEDDADAPLAPRIDRLCKLLMGRIAVVFKGHISAGPKRLNLVGVYVTEEQLQEISLK